MTDITKYYIHFIDCDGEDSIIDHGFNSNKEATDYAKKKLRSTARYTIQNHARVKLEPVDKDALEYMRECDYCNKPFFYSEESARHEANSRAGYFCDACCDEWDAATCDDCGNHMHCCECNDRVGEN